MSYSINGKTCHDLASQKKAKLLLAIIFCSIGSIFAIIGMCFFLSTPSPDEYTKYAEAEFSYLQTDRKTSTSSRKINGIRRTTTTTKYVPVYIGAIGEQSYTYEYHTEFATQDKANQFTNTHPTLMVTSYLDKNQNQVLLASDLTLKEYFSKEKMFTLIFAGIGMLFFIIGVIVACIPIGKGEIS